MASNVPSQEGQRHVFISYQWDSQPMIKKVVDNLKKEGFKVWVDLDNMSGSILESMAKAVEDSAVVIVCLSQKYRDSRNCKTEAEYVYRKEKDIVPIRLQPDYWPSGGLGALVGNRLMLDFTSDGAYPESFKKLISELGVRGKSTENEEKNAKDLPEKKENDITDRMKQLLNKNPLFGNEGGCVSALKKMTAANTKLLKNLTEGVVYALEESTKKKSTSTAGEEGKGHIFISYQGESQEVVKKVVNSLKERGYKIWVDYEDTSEFKLDAMATAMEEAAAVIICISPKNITSRKCLTEAEYAFLLHKKIIPIRVQSDPLLSCKLGTLIDNKIMQDFTSDAKYSESLENLIKELGVRGKNN